MIFLSQCRIGECKTFESRVIVVIIKLTPMPSYIYICLFQTVSFLCLSQNLGNYENTLEIYNISINITRYRIFQRHIQRHMHFSQVFCK